MMWDIDQKKPLSATVVLSLKRFNIALPRHRNHRMFIEMFIDLPYVAISQSSMPNDQLKMIKKKDAFI